MHINLSGMALVPWEANALCVQLRALDVMTSPVVVLDPVMSVGQLHQLIFDHPHHAFPVVEGDRDPRNFTYGHLVGMISAQYIALMIKKKVSFVFNKAFWLTNLQNGIHAVPNLGLSHSLNEKY